MKGNIKNVTGYLVFALLVVGLGFGLFKTSKPAVALDIFAKCLAEKKVTMYGADWCSHCQNEKKAFGESFKFVPYVECPDNIKVCTDLDIKGYPTWVFGDGHRLEGELGLRKLAEESGCDLPTGIK